MARKLIIIVTALIASLITSYGCYTIIKHPSVLESEADGSGVHEGASKDCVSCHADYHQYPYGYYYSYYPDYYWDYPRWGTYYAYPWWWDDYWYAGGGTAAGGGGGTVGGGGTGPSKTASKPATRRGLIPPYVAGYDTSMIPVSNLGVPTLPPAVIAPPSSGGTTTGGTVTTPPTTKTKDASKKEESKPPKRRK